MDDSCVTDVPRGGRIDAGRREVYDWDDNLVGNVKTCTEQLPTCPANGGWYEWSWANAQTIGGLQQYNWFEEWWTVPRNPAPPNDDQPLEYYFPSLQSESVFGNQNTVTGIVQPVLSWGYSGQEWEVSAWVLLQCNSSCVCDMGVNGPFSGVNAGDSILGYMDQIAGNPDGWEVDITDYTTGAYAYYQVTGIPNSWPKFNTAQGGVNENYGLNTCNDLSAAHTIQFQDPYLYQAGPNWNSYNNVTNSTSWSGHSAPMSLFPYCAWSVTANDTGTTLNWL